MLNDVVVPPPDAPVSLAQPETPLLRKAYTAPTLQELGDVRSVTLGVSPGVNDSNDPFNLEA